MALSASDSWLAGCSSGATAWSVIDYSFDAAPALKKTSTGGEMNLRNWRSRIVIALGVVAFGFSGIAQAQCGPTDVVFVVDNTGSMSDVIAQVQSQVNVIADKVVQVSGGDYQFGLVVAPSNDVNVLLDMSARNRDALATAVDQMSTIGSCGEPAAWDDGMDTVLNHLAAGRTVGGGNGTQIGTFAGQFRSSATKILIVISDARPNHQTGCDFTAGVDDTFVHNLAAVALGQGIHVAAVFVPTASAQAFGFVPTIQQIFADMAQTGDGIYLQTQPDASDLSVAIQSIVEACGVSGGLLVDPTDIVISNGETVDVAVTNYRPGRDFSNLIYGSNGLPEDSKVTFTRQKPVVLGTDLQTMHVTIGPETLAGTYVLNVSANRKDTSAVQRNYVLVNVDCVAPMILGTPGHQPLSQTIATGKTATLSVAPTGTSAFKYQWFQGHSGSTAFPIAGATSASYTTPALTGPGEYWVRVYSPCGSIDSQTAAITTQ
jgi:hypothetical protein